MQRSANFDLKRRAWWCAPVILLAVCSLTISVATRYCSPEGIATYASKTLHKHSPIEKALQRLNKEAANWIPPVVHTVVLHAPSSYPRIAPSGPPMPTVLFDESLYNRPPPQA